MKMFRCDRCGIVQNLYGTGFGDATASGHNCCLIRTQRCAYDYDLCDECMEIVETALKAVVNYDS